MSDKESQESQDHGKKSRKTQWAKKTTKKRKLIAMRGKK